MSILKIKKDEMRKEFRQRRKEISPLEKAQRENCIVQRAKALVSFRFAEYVLLYAATDDEINIDAVALEALKKGKKIAFPRCNKENCTMQFHVVEGLDDLKPDSYGIREPSALAPVFDPSHHKNSAVCFVPALVFDRKGYRLGYGRGYYDRYLSSFSGSRIGVVCEDFIVDSVPRGRFDAKVDILLTEKSIKVPNEN